MKRNRIIAILLFIFELCCIIGIGKFLYHDVSFKVTKVSAKNLYISKEEDSNGKFKVTFTTQCPNCNEYHIDQKVFLTKEELDEFKKTNIIKLYWCDLHFDLWLILYYFIGCLLTLLAFFSSKACFSDCYQTMRPGKCEFCPAYLKCKICFNADLIDFDPAKKKLFNFFGYETSSSDTDSGNNC